MVRSVDEFVNVDVFISYSSKNKNVADAVVSDFERNGIRCWYAPRDILPGREWVPAIKEGICSAKVFILLFTEESNTSRQVMNEVAMAFNAEKTIVPFKLTQEEMSDELEYYLTRVHWLDAVSQPLSGHIEELRKYVQLILSGSEPRAARERKSSGEVTRKKRSKVVWAMCAAAMLVTAAVLLLIFRPFGSGKKPKGGGENTQVEEEYVTLQKQAEEYFQNGDHNKALESYLASIGKGNTDTSVYRRVASIFLDGTSDRGEDEEQGLRYLEMAYNDGNGEKLTADEYYRLAYKYDSDEAVKDPEKAARYALAGAEAGSVQCMLMIGEAFLYGNGVEQDYGQVLKWFGSALDSGIEGYSRNYCINCISMLVENGHVTREAASKWLK